MGPFRLSLMRILLHGTQISPDKNVSFPCTTAAFTLPLEPTGFALLCQLAQGLSLICGFCSSARTYVYGFLQTVGRPPALAFDSYFCNTGSRTGDLHPISSRPCRAYTIQSTGRMRNCAGYFWWFSLRSATGEPGARNRPLRGGSAPR